MRRTLAIAAVAAGALAGAPTGAARAAPPKYTVTDLGTDHTVNGFRHKIVNSAGEVIGGPVSEASNPHGSIYRDGTWHDLGDTNPSGTVNHGNFAYGLNDRGQVVGEGDTGGDKGQIDAFLYSNGAIAPLGIAVGSDLSTDARANAINGSGLIVGMLTHYGATNTQEPFLARVGVGVIDLPGWAASVFAVNTSGDVLGSAIALGPPHTRLNGDPLPASTDGFTPMALNDAREVLLSAQGVAVNGAWGLVYDAVHGTTTTLPTLSANGATYLDLNAAGQVVGRGYDAGFANHAFVWSKATGIVALDDLGLTVGATAVHLTRAEGIGNRGHIVCLGTLDGDADEHVFLLTPAGLPAPGVAGVYDGPAKLGGVALGVVSLKVAASGSFKGTLRTAAGTHALRGAFAGGDFDGATTSGGATLAAHLHIDAATGEATGTVSDGTTTFDVSADRAAAPAPLVGRYTALIQAPAGGGVPSGVGHATLNVAKSGRVAISGRLGDGAPFAATAQLHADGSFAFFAAAGSGSIAGRVDAVRAFTGSDLSGALHWVVPGASGFTVDASLVAARYAAPAKGAHVLRFTGEATADLVLSGGGLTGDVRHVLSFSSNDGIAATDAGADALKLKVDRKSGLVSGTFVHPATGKRTRVSGVVQQKLNRIDGEFAGAPAGSLAIVPR